MIEERIFEMSSSNERIHGYDVLRVIATFAVIIIHTSTVQLTAAPLNSSGWQAMIFWDGLARWAVPLFFMLSGALFLPSDKPFPEILKKNCLRIFTAFLFWSLIYTAISWFTSPEGLGGWKAFLYTWISGHYHLWFCWAILALYLLVPLLRPLARNIKTSRYFLLLALIFASAVPMLLVVIYYVSPRLCILGNTVIGKMNMQFPMGYTGVFVLGCYLAVHAGDRARKPIYILGIIGAVITPVSAIVLSLIFGRAITDFYPYLMPNVVFPAAAIFLLLKDFRSRIPGFWKILSGASFGAYLIHVLILDAFSRIGFSPLSFSPWISVPLIAASVALVSFTAGALIRRIPVVGKYIS